MMTKLLFLGAQTELSELPVHEHIRNELQTMFLAFVSHAGQFAGLKSQKSVSETLRRSLTQPFKTSANDL